MPQMNGLCFLRGVFVNDFLVREFPMSIGIGHGMKYLVGKYYKGFGQFIFHQELSQQFRPQARSRVATNIHICQ